MLKTCKGEETVSKIKDDQARKIITLYARGNVSMQKGNFLTEEDIDNRLKRLGHLLEE